MGIFHSIPGLGQLAVERVVLTMMSKKSAMGQGKQAEVLQRKGDLMQPKDTPIG